MSRPVAPPRPLPTPKPGKVKVVRAKFNYTSQASDELTFEEGDLLYIVDQTSSKDWWKARCGSKLGLIPSNYVADNTESIDNPLHEAAKRGNIEFLNECLTNQVSVNSLDKSGSIALHWACNGGHMECIEALLKAGSRTDVQNKMGDTPVHSAAWKNQLHALEALIAKGAKLDVKNNDGKMAMDMAHDPSCAALLKDKTKPRALSMEEYGDEEDSD